MLAAEFVKTEVKEFLNQFELHPHEKNLLVKLSNEIIRAYEQYRHMVSIDVKAKIDKRTDKCIHGWYGCELCKHS